MIGNIKSEFTKDNGECITVKYLTVDDKLNTISYYDFKNRLHRLNGPAIECIDDKNKNCYYLQGHFYHFINEKEWEKTIKFHHLFFKENPHKLDPKYYDGDYQYIKELIYNI